MVRNSKLSHQDEGKDASLPLFCSTIESLANSISLEKEIESKWAWREEMKLFVY